MSREYFRIVGLGRWNWDGDEVICGGRAREKYKDSQRPHKENGRTDGSSGLHTTPGRAESA
jgi:hypothetical protein